MEVPGFDLLSSDFTVERANHSANAAPPSRKSLSQLEPPTMNGSAQPFLFYLFLVAERLCAAIHCGRLCSTFKNEPGKLADRAFKGIWKYPPQKDAVSSDSNILRALTVLKACKGA